MATDNVKSENNAIDNCLFTTERLLVCNCASLFQKDQIIVSEKVITLLTPAVVKALPSSWQDIENTEQAVNWLKHRFNESTLLAVKLTQSDEIIGFIFIYEQEQETKSNNQISLHLGYLLGEKYWYKGYASEVLTALVGYYKIQSKAKLLLAGVTADNTASINVLTKCGFELTGSEMTAEGNLFYQRRL